MLTGRFNAENAKDAKDAEGFNVSLKNFKTPWITFCELCELCVLCGEISLARCTDFYLLIFFAAGIERRLLLKNVP